MNHPYASITLAILIGLAGCSSSPTAEGQAKEEHIAAADNKTGAQLWAENCMRCHNLRSPSDFTPAQWAVINHEMRVRACLSGVEQRRIWEFLQAASR